MSIVLQFFPNGEFTKGINTAPRRKERRDKQRGHGELTRECKEGYLEWVRSTPNSDSPLCVPGRQFLNQRGEKYTYDKEDFEGHWYYWECLDGFTYYVLMNEPIGRMVARGELTPLVHQLVESSPLPSKPSRKRLDSMTKNMARNIRNGVYLLEQDYGKDCLSFLTLTLPNLTQSDLRLCCERWDYMTDQILKSLRKRLLSKGIEFEYVYCTEIQVKRATIRKEYVPHLHIVFRGRSGKKKPWAITPKQIRKTWAGVIANVVAHTEFTQTALENLQRVKYSAARYLGKYLSKGKCSNPVLDESEADQKIHTQWGGMARNIARRLKSCTVRLGGLNSGSELAVSILRAMDKLLESGLVNYFAVGHILLGNSDGKGMERFLEVGCGCLRTPTYEGGLIDVVRYVGTL